MIPRAVGAALAIATAAVVVWASSVPLAVNRSGPAVLRLAWGAHPERIENCRRLSPEELAKLPQHMRQERVCEGTTAEYRLLVMEGDAVRIDRIIRGGGLRRDRRLYVFEELPVPAGPAVFDVRFDRITHPADDVDGRDDDDERGGGGQQKSEDARRSGAVPAALSLAIRATARPGQVILVTYDPDRRALVAVTGHKGSIGS